MSEQKVLVFDIETAPMLAYVWGRRDVNIAVNQIAQDWFVLAWSAKWLGDPASKIIYQDQSKAKDITDDSAILQPLWNLLNEADIVLTHNGKSFDVKKINARFLLLGTKPPKPYKHIDTLRIVRQVAYFTSSSLAYLTDKFCTKYKKLSHAKFPGQVLWTECLAGNKEAWQEMKRYNINDVLSLEEFYLKIRAWSPVSTPAVHTGPGCQVCGHFPLRRKGFEIRANGKRVQQYKCMACGKWAHRGLGQ